MFKIISKKKFDKMQETIRREIDAKRAAGYAHDVVKAQNAELEKALAVLQGENKMLRSACKGMEQQLRIAHECAGAAEKENRMMSAAIDAIAAEGNKTLLALGFEALVKEGLA